MNIHLSTPRRETFLGREVDERFIGSALALVALFFLALAGFTSAQSFSLGSADVFNRDNPMMRLDSFASFSITLIALASGNGWTASRLTRAGIRNRCADCRDWPAGSAAGPATSSWIKPLAIPTTRMGPGIAGPKTWSGSGRPGKARSRRWSRGGG